jgi:hypothetical protein
VNFKDGLTRTYSEMGSRAELLVRVAVLAGGLGALMLIVLVVADIGSPWDLTWAVVVLLLGTLSIGSALAATVLYQLRDVLWTLSTSSKSAQAED